MKYDFNSNVRYSEINEEGKLSISALVNYFQDTSTFQSEGLGKGIEYMKEHGLAWVLASWQIVIDRLPELGEKIISRTWPYGFNSFYGLRNFVLTDEKEKPLAWANSIWALIDVEKQRPVRVPSEILETYELEEKLDMEYADRKVPAPKGGVKEASFEIGKHLLDTNHHVNNGQYIALAAAYLPENFPVGQMRAEYRMQARLHDVMVPIVSRQEDVVTVALCNEKEKPYAVVEFSRKPLD